MAFKFDVVISGISGRFPECDDVDTFRKKLYSADPNEFITNNDKKWTRGFKLHRYADENSIPNATGKYTMENDFDFRLFKFNQQMARSTDIINRKILEPSFEAIVDAGINPYSLDGANVGVFMTAGIAERDMYCVENAVGQIFVLGNSRTMGPNRLSYALNLTGPSYTCHSDPLGGLEALRIAREQISDGTIEAAVVAVASNVTDPKFSYLYMYLKLLTCEDVCRCFDKNANGFVRSEATIVFYLQRAQDAKRHYAKLVFCDTFFEGLSPHTILGYDEEYLKNALRVIYERNADDALAEDVSFMELTGCAVKRFECNEANAVADVLCKQRTNPLLVGSVKSCVGHTEASSGLLSVLKTILALDSQLIPPNSNCMNTNDDIRAFRDNQLKVVTEETKLPGNIAAVNIVGLYGGVNHVVLQKNSREPEESSFINKNLPRLLLMSGRTEDGLRQVMRKIESSLRNTASIALANEVFYKDMPFHIYRGFTLLPKTENSSAVIEERGNTKRPICFVFSGMGSQWNGMGMQLLNLPIFAEVLQRCDAVLKPKSIDIYKVLLSEDPALFDDITMSFVAIICMQIALVEVLRKLNIVPDLILGHSVGENGCAYADGCLTLEQAVSVSYARGIASTSTKTIKGMMAAIGKGYEEIRHCLPKNIEVACHNAFNSCTLSGPAEDIEMYVGELKKQAIFAKSVNVANIAYHSQYIAPAAPKLLELLRKIIPHPNRRSSKWISSSVPESEWHLSIAERCSAEYLTNNLLKPVLFEEACRHIPKNAIVIEIAPHGLLQAILKRALPETCTSVSLTRRSVKKENLNVLLSGIGKLFIAGCEPSVNNLYPPVEYPVPRGTPSISPYCTWFHGDCDVIKPLYKPAKPVPLSKENIIVRINEDAEFSYLRYHRIRNQTVIPPAFFLHLVWRMLSVYKNVKMDDSLIMFENIKVHRNVKISISEPRLINILIQGSGSFEVLSRAKMNKKETKVILTGRVEFIQDEVKIPSHNFESISSKSVIKTDEIDDILKEADFQLGQCFQLLKELKVNNAESLAKIEWRGNWVAFLDSMVKFQMLSSLRESKLCYMHSVRRIVIHPLVINSLPLGSQVVGNYDRTTKCFQCNGIEMNDVKWKISSHSSTIKCSPLKIREMRFVSYDNPSCQSPNEFIELGLQIALECLETSSKTDSKLHICDCTEKFVKFMPRSIIKYVTNKSKVLFHDRRILTTKDLLLHENYFFITEEDIPIMDASRMEDLFVLLIDCKDDLTDFSGEFVTIMKQRINGRNYFLLKKKLKCSPRIRVETNDIPEHPRLNDYNNNSKTEVVIRPNLDSTGLRLMFSKKKRPNTKYIFVCEPNNKLQNGNGSKIMSKLSSGLPITVIKNHDWGSYKYLPSNRVDENGNYSNPKECLTSNIQIESIRVESIHKEIPSAPCDVAGPSSKNQPIGVGFSGVNASGQNVIGLTAVNVDESVAQLDPLLTWQVPADWTFAEAANIPLIYAHVYRIPKIIEHSHYIPTPKILINAGEDMLVVEICASLCVLKNYDVFVTVFNIKQVRRLRQNCPWLKESQIIFNECHRFDHQVLYKTKKEGVNVVVNYLPGLHNLSASINCLSNFSYYIETVESNMNENYEIGMSPFGKSLYFIASPYNISHLLKLRADDKEALHEAVKEGIKEGFVRPIQRLNEVDKCKEINTMFEQVEMKTGSKSPSVINDFRYARESLKFKPNHSHIILGGAHCEEAWIQLMYWLKDRGASSFVVILEKLASWSRMSHQLNGLLTKRGTTVAFKSLSELNSVEDAAQLIAETNKVAPVDSVFFVSLDSYSQKIQFMDVASQQCEKTIKFVSIFSGGLDEMESRRNKGLPAFVLHGESFPKNLPDVLTEFEKILNTYDLNNGSGVLYHVLDEIQLSGFQNNISLLRHYLPKSVECLERIGRHITGKIEFVEMTSKCLKLADCRGVLPIFVVPSLHALELQPFYHTLMYPVFCASLSENCSSILDTATKLFEHLKRIQPYGPVTLVGETWNAAVAIELSSIIKRDQREFRLFLLEGNPIEWKETIKSLNLTNCQDLEKILIQIYGDELLRCFSSFDQMKESKTNVPGTNEFFSNQVVSRRHVHRCLNVLKQTFINANEYTINDSLLENTVLFSKSVPQNISSVLSNTSDIIYVAEGNYETFIGSRVISKKINKEAMFDWNYS